MPCRCDCGSNEESKGMRNKESEINFLLSIAAKEIHFGAEKHECENDYYDTWLEAFEHHLKGCPEKGVSYLSSQDCS